MKKFYENKIFIIASLFLIFGAVTVIATTIGDSGFSGIQVDNYFSGSGKQGITQNVSFNDYDNNSHFLEFEDGLLVDYNLTEAPGPYQTSLPQSENLVAYYSFNANNGINQEDDVLGNYNGTITGSVVNTSGKIGNAMDWEGDADYITYSGFPNFLNMHAFSVSWWTYPEESENYYVISRSGEYEFRLNSGDSEFYSTYSSAPSGYGVSTGTWTHLVGVSNTTHNLLYVDGVLREVIELGASTSDSAYDLQLGFRASGLGGTQWYNGSIDELGFWNTSLDDGNCTLGSTCGGEIAELYNDGTGLTY